MTSSQARKQKNAVGRNRGAVLVAALVALFIVMSLLGTMLLAAVQSRRQMSAERNARQCELLLRAGMDRAAAQFAGDSTYSGETWQLSSSDALPSGDARVEIAVQSGAAGNQKQLKITAEYPLGDEWSIRRSFSGTFTGRTSTREEN